VLTYTPALAQYILQPLLPGRALAAFACRNCCLIISPLSEEQAAFSLALVYKHWRGQTPTRKDMIRNMEWKGEMEILD
jgi:hypothetical protein